MAYKANWAQPFLDINRERRRRVEDEVNQRDARMMATLQRQQLQAQMTQQEQDRAADEAASTAIGQFGAPVAAPMPPVQLVTQPDVDAGGMPSNYKIQPSLRSRPGYRDALPAAVEQAAAERVARHPDFAALAASGQVPQQMLGVLAKSPRWRQLALDSIKAGMGAPRQAYNLEQDYIKAQDEMRSRRDTLANARAGTRSTREYQTGMLGVQQDQERRAAAKEANEQSFYGGIIQPGLKKFAETFGTGAANVITGQGSVNVAEVNAREKAADRAQRKAQAEAKIAQGAAVLAQKESEFTRKLHAMQAESDTGRRQQISIEVYKLQGALERDRSALNKMREMFSYTHGGEDPGAALALEGGPIATTEGWFSDSQTPTAPRATMPPPPIAESVLKQQARQVVATMTPEQKAAEKARLRALRGK